MARYYPHKQTLIIFIVCVIAVTSIAVYVTWGNKNSGISQKEITARQNVQATEPIDNIPESNDWKKSFLDSSTTALVSTKGAASKQPAVQEPETLTGQFGKSFFARFMLLQQNNQTNDDAAIKTVIDQSLNDLTSSAPQPKMYREKDIVISNQTDTSSERNYANAVGSIFYTYAPHSDPATIAGEALDNDDAAILKEIDPIINSYAIMVEKLRAISVPKTLASSHLDLINGVSSMLFISQGMKQVMSDPAQGLVALSIYGNSQDMLRSALLELNAYFVRKAVSFSQTEPGAFFATIR